MNTEQPTQRTLGPAKIAAWLCLGPLGAGLVVAILGPLLGGSLWLLDLSANLAAQWLVLALVALIVGVWVGIRGGGKGIVRRWWLAGLAGVALLAQVMVMAPGRAVWVENGPVAGAASGEIEVLIYNAFSQNQTPERAIELVERSDADVVVLLEQRRKFAMDSVVIGERFPWIEVRRPIDGRSPWMLVCSKWPTRPMGEAEGFAPTPGCFPVLIEAPSGSFGVVAIHAQSPRGPAPWRNGNLSVRAAASAVERFAEMGFDAIVAGDLNATPSGWRSRWLGRTSKLRRSRPMGRMTGTWPSDTPWPLSVAIDDVWAPEEWRLVRWETTGGPGYGGSDHRAVRVELLRPAGRSAGALEPGDDEPPKTTPLSR